MKFSELSFYLEKLEKTSSRIEITKILADLFKKTNKEEIDKTCYLLLGSLAPGYKGIVFSIAEKMMLRVLAKAYETDPEKVLKLYKEKGDIGGAAYELVNKIKGGKGKGLTISQVHEKLLEIAKESGEESQERKVDKTAELLRELDRVSAKFVARIPVGRLRLGFSDKTILDALSWMETGGKDKKSKLEAAFNILPDVGLLAREVKEKGIDKATMQVEPKIGTPVLPMLAARLNSTSEMIEKMKRVFVEPKFDGLRIQIHYKKSGFIPTPLEASRGEKPKVRAFTRNLNETSWMFPELTGIEKYIEAKEVILDTEAVGVDPQRKAMANFQTTMTRRRKHDIGDVSKKVSIKFNVFDIMYLNGKGLVYKKYEERRKLLADSVNSGELLDVVEYEITDNPVKIAELMQRQLKEGMEGIIVKKADSNYIAGRTGWRWVKMKQVEGQSSKLADTVDCVVMGYSAGRGKRVSFGLGQFLVGVKDKDEFKTVTKVGTGLTDVQFKELKKRLSGLTTKEKPKGYMVNKILEPDFWVTPEVVVEIAADEITKSPNHTSGLALRFPRLIKFRDDKGPEEATTVSEIEKLFKLQKLT